MSTEGRMKKLSIEERIPQQFRMTRGTVLRLEAYIQAAEDAGSKPPTKREVVEMALVQFLDECDGGQL